MGFSQTTNTDGFAEVNVSGYGSGTDVEPELEHKSAMIATGYEGLSGGGPVDRLGWKFF